MNHGPLRKFRTFWKSFDNMSANEKIVRFSGDCGVCDCVGLPRFREFGKVAGRAEEKIVLIRA